MTSQKIIQQGAEAKIILKDKHIIKDRISKSYRHPQLDKKIIKSRTKKENKLLNKASLIISAPKSEINSYDKLKMPYIQGKKLSEHLGTLDYKKICKQIGISIAKLHDQDIIHGDLTTSNMIWTTNSREVVNKKPLGVLHLIDFGLGFTNHRIEDKAVDLHLIKQALEAKHHTIHEACWNQIKANYNTKNKQATLNQLEKVESRGRYKKGC